MQLLELETLQQWRRVLPVARPSSVRMPKLGLSLLFVDSRIDVEVSDTVLSSIAPFRMGIQNTIGVRLSRQRGGLLQISDVLQWLIAIDSLYIVGQGEGDCIWLGNACLRSSMLLRYQHSLARWRQYGGCDRGELPIWFCGNAALMQALAQGLTHQFQQLTRCPVTALEWNHSHSLGLE